MIIDEDQVRWIGRAEGGKTVTSRDRIVNVSEIEEVPPVALATLKRLMPQRHHEALNRRGILPSGAAAAVRDALTQALPDFAGLLDRLERGSLLLPSGKRGELLNEQRDGLGLLLDIAGIGRRPVRSWSVPPVGVPFLEGIPQRDTIEDLLIAHDMEVFQPWSQLPTSDVAWRSFTDGQRRLFVMNANRTSVEKTLGVDVVYWNEHFDAFVLVQYKKMRPEGEGHERQLTYRPDANIEAELQRMRAVDEACAVQDGDFRLLATPCWLKLCDPKPVVKDPSKLIGGMYFAREHFDHLLQNCKGPRGGTRISYTNVDRYFNNTMFVDLVRDGWIGSRGGGSALVQTAIQESLQSGHAVLVGVQAPAQQS
ncbi:hypothetical protein M2302_005972 [Micromonospora sp. A200]|uniref:hypothetical protein n=1 Tax=Micromonospora sp. A200 TaxID=2940568 RepID=UPI002472F0F9|nr:hypothetical protein [Micromonospora sp. A200]MDH6465770.1 hypothetical protein [Micromonospora sp. A200]